MMKNLKDHKLEAGSLVSLKGHYSAKDNLNTVTVGGKNSCNTSLCLNSRSFNVLQGAIAVVVEILYKASKEDTKVIVFEFSSKKLGWVWMTEVENL